jgi:hypothetical protein
MLPVGLLALGARKTNFTPAEQRTLMTLWGIARSPLIIGADLTHLDDFTLALLKTPEVLRMNQFGKKAKFAEERDGFVVWTSEDSEHQTQYVAVFNTNDAFSLKRAKRIARSERVDRNHLNLELSAEIKGFQHIALVVTDAGDGFAYDHAVWVDPILKGSDGKEISLSTMKWKSAHAGFGQVSTSRDPEGRPLLIDGKRPTHAISAHAPSTVVFEVPKDAVTFSSKLTLSDTARKQNQGGTVEFEIWGFESGPNDQGEKPTLDLTKYGVSDHAKVKRVWTDHGDLIAPHDCQLYVIAP